MAKAELAKSLIESVKEIASISDHRPPMKKHFAHLSRRLKLLLPMLEEIRDCRNSLPEEQMVEALLSLKESLIHAKDLLIYISQVSKIYLVLERDKVIVRFQKVTALLEQALSEIPYRSLEISDELQEQVELVLVQLRREIGKGGGEKYDDELYKDLLSLYGGVTDSEVLRRVAGKLQLMTVTDLTEESLALLDMVSSCGGDDPGENFEKMMMLLKKIKDFVQTYNPNLDDVPLRSKPSLSKSQQDEDPKNVPDDFRCPISLKLMSDPVIVSSGQTYDRDCIKKWLEEGNSTCPKTQETLTSDTVTPNYALRSLIAQWCESNGIEPPKRPKNPQPSSKASSSSSSSSFSSPPSDEQLKIEELLRKLTSQRPEEQRSAAGEIRLLAKQNNHNRVSIAASGAIPLLVNLLTTSDDPRTQEHAVTSILNLSIFQENKGRIVSTFGAVPGIVYVLKKGSMEARENAAATLFSLSVIDENKVTIGAAGAIPPLVNLLSEGSQRGKKDAGTALFNLCIFQGNKGKAVRAGLVPVLMRLLTEPEGRMVDEALAILAILSSHPDGKVVVGAADAVPIMVEFIRSGSPRNKENAAAVLVQLCSWDPQYLIEADKLGIMGCLIEMAENGTDRGKRKAAQLLNRFSRFNEQQRQSGLGVEDQDSLI
ncbi:hypothetical protein Bca52824_028257 [Brassica carinata]|uniref:U-box domain-containing protein 12 n=1 Tax=Brassica carinata TaxID=52824 RepID=A0A8X7VC89_BRACI|nr:hypothetical protein Bca52824_028257 [Brassica carinata]